MRSTPGPIRHLKWWGALTLLAVLGFAHARTVALGWDYVGPLIVLDHVFDIIAVLVLAAICAGVGRLALRRLGADPLRPIDSLLFSVVAGTALVATLFLLLGTVGLLHSWVVALSLAALVAVSWSELRQLPRLAVDAFLAPWRESEDPVFLALALGVTGAALAFMVVFAVAPPVDWDGLMYHLDLPAEYLEAGRIFLPADNLHVSHVGVIHMLFIPLLAVSSSSGPAVLNVLFALLLGLAMYAFCSRLLSVRTGHLASGLVWGTTTVLFVAISPRIDVGLALFLFLAQYALIVAVTERQSDTGRFYFLAALASGVAIGTKLSAVPYALALAPLAVWAAARRGRSAAGAARALFAFGAVALAAALPWLAKNWLLMGSPLYPFFSDPRLPPWLATLFGGTGWPAQVDPSVTQLVWEFREPFNLRDAFFFPGRLTIEGEGKYYFLNPALLALPLTVLYLRQRAVIWMVFPALIYLALVLVVQPSPNLRYLLPAIPPLTIAVVYAVLRAGQRLLSVATLRVLIVALTLIALTPSGIGAGWRIANSRALAHFVGIASASEYIASWLGSAYVNVVKLTEETLDGDSRVLMLFEARGYYFDTPVIQDNTSDNWPLLAAALSPEACLPGAIGVTHVLVGIGSLRYYAFTGGLNPERIRWNEFRALADRCLEPVYGDELLILFRVRDESEVTRKDPAR